MTQMFDESHNIDIPMFIDSHDRSQIRAELFVLSWKKFPSVVFVSSMQIFKSKLPWLVNFDATSKSALKVNKPCVSRSADLGLFIDGNVHESVFSFAINFKVDTRGVPSHDWWCFHSRVNHIKVKYFSSDRRKFEKWLRRRHPRDFHHNIWFNWLIHEDCDRGKFPRTVKNSKWKSYGADEIARWRRNSNEIKSIQVRWQNEKKIETFVCSMFNHLTAHFPKRKENLR